MSFRISHLSDIPFANNFSHYVTWLLILLTVPFAKQIFLILIKSSLSIMSFMGNAFDGIPKKSHYHTPGYLVILLCSFSVRDFSILLVYILMCRYYVALITKLWRIFLYLAIPCLWSLYQSFPCNSCLLIFRYKL